MQYAKSMLRHAGSTSGSVAFLSIFLLLALVTPGQTPSPCSIPSFGDTPSFDATYPVANNSSGLTLADFDGDGYEDIATGRFIGDNVVSVYQNDRNGGFELKLNLSTLGESVHRVYAADFDGDGRTDIGFTSAFDDWLYFFRNLTPPGGAVTFQFRQYFPIAENQGRIMTIGNFDGDGRVDTATAVHGIDGDGISVLRSKPNQQFGIDFEPFDLIPNPGLNISITSGDIDGDGKLDFVVGSNDIEIFRNVTPGPGPVAFEHKLQIDLNRARDVALADLDGDGRLDLIGLDNLEEFVSFFRNTGTAPGEFSFGPEVRFTLELGLFDIETADFNGDGKTDVAISNQNEYAVHVLQNNSPGPGTISFAPRKWDFAVGTIPEQLDIGNIDGDGKPDIAVINREQSTISYLLNKTQPSGTIEFKSNKNYMTPYEWGANSVKAGDFDGDGHTDIVTSLEDLTRIHNTFSVFENDGTGFYGSRRDIALTAYPTVIDVIDADLNGRPDIIGATEFGLRIIRNTSAGNGSFTFSLLPAAFGGLFTSFIDHADFDSDGRVDLVTIDESPDNSPDTVRIILNTTSGPGTFGFNQVLSFTVPENSNPSFQITDMNSDGKPDLMHGQEGPKIAMYLNTSTGPGNVGFEQVNLQEIGIGYDSPVAADFDGDGHTDLLAVWLYNVIFYKNLGNPDQLEFAPKVVFPQSKRNFVTVGDADGDGRVDAIAWTRGGASFDVLQNQTGDNGIFDFTITRNFVVSGNSNTGSNSSYYFGDVNDDGRPDLLNAHRTGDNGNVGVLLNRSCGFQKAKYMDFDGDGRSDLGIYRPGPSSALEKPGPEGGSSQWWILNSSNISTWAAAFGQPADIPVPADFSGDGKTDAAFFRPSTAEWFVLRSQDQTYYGFPFGAPGDIPAPGDFDGDGIADPAVFRPSSGTWYALRSSDSTVATYAFGTDGDRPIVADYDGDGKDDPAIYRPSSGQFWHLRSSAGPIGYEFGAAGDLPLRGDFTGDGKADVALFRPSTSEWFVIRSEDSSYFAFPWGVGGDIPVPADYDGDGKADPAVFRPDQGVWYINGTTSGFQAFPFGAPGDVPLPSVVSAQ